MKYYTQTQFTRVHCEILGCYVDPLIPNGAGILYGGKLARHHCNHGNVCYKDAVMRKRRSLVHFLAICQTAVVIVVGFPAQSCHQWSNWSSVVILVGFPAQSCHL